MKFRIVPVIANSVKYKIQVKSFGRWKDIAGMEGSAFGNAHFMIRFGSVESAVSHIYERFGKESRVIEWSPE